MGNARLAGRSRATPAGPDPCALFLASISTRRLIAPKPASWDGHSLSDAACQAKSDARPPWLAIPGGRRGGTGIRPVHKATGEKDSGPVLFMAAPSISRRRVRAAAGGRPFRIVVGKYAFDRVCRTYADVPAGEALALYGSQDTLEISINCGNAAEVLGIGRGDEVRVVRMGA